MKSRLRRKMCRRKAGRKLLKEFRERWWLPLETTNGEGEKWADLGSVLRENPTGLKI